MLLSSFGSLLRPFAHGGRTLACGDERGRKLFKIVLRGTRLIDVQHVALVVLRFVAVARVLVSPCIVFALAGEERVKKG